MKLKSIAVLAASLLVGSLQAQAYEPVQPIRAAAPANPALVELGKALHFYPRLSRSGFVACNSCHNLSMGGSDNLQTSIGHNWQQGPINAPTVLNSSMNLAQSWDGRAKNLKTQAGGPIANPGEMAFTHELAVDVLASVPQYGDMFKRTFGSSGIDIDRVTEAIAAFEETLVTPDSRFDLSPKGDMQALTKAEQEGYKLFKDSGCIACHCGPALGEPGSRRWVSSRTTIPRTRPKAWPILPARMSTACASRFPPCATSS